MMNGAESPAIPYSGIIHAAREAIIAVDEQQFVVMLNPAAEQMFGRTAAQALGRPVSQFIPPRYRAVHAEHVRRFDASGLIEHALDQRRQVIGLRADGCEFPVEATVSRVEVTGALGPQPLFVAMLRDLTQEEGLKAELVELKQRFQAIFELAPVAIWVAEGDRIVFANRACANLFGMAHADRLLGRSIYELLRAESHATLRQHVAHALAGSDDVPVLHERIARPDGSVREIEIAVASLPPAGTMVQMVITDITRRRREAQELERSRRELRELSANLVQAREEERRRIARELHDELGQRLTALKMELSSVRGSAEPCLRDPRIAAMLQMLDETVASVRHIASDLRPLMLDDLGLNAAIEWLARDAGQRMGIDVTVRLGEDDPLLAEEASIALYRMVQEALTNVARHARATQVNIELVQRDGKLILNVCDNGIGFPLQSLQREGSYGLMGIRERAYMLGGHMKVVNPPGGGGCITVHLPLERSGGVPAGSDLR